MKTGKTRSKTGRNSAPHSSPESGSASNAIDWESRIAVAAYYKSESRGFTPGYELNDWVDAEKELTDWMSTEMEEESC